MYERPVSLRSALDALANGPRMILAGGTDFYPALHDTRPSNPVLDITAIKELRGLRREDGGWRIGALTTWTDILRADLPPAFDGLKLAAREVGSIQIQNRATVAGNLCNASPAADGVPPLLTLDAKVELISTRDSRTLDISDFIKDNRKTDLRADELVSAVIIPDVAGRGRSSFLKLGARKYLVISIAMVAARICADDTGRITDARVAVGACSAVARRLMALEKALVGRYRGDGFAGVVNRDHLAPLSPIDDVRAPASYRYEAAREIVVRALEAAS